MFLREDLIRIVIFISSTILVFTVLANLEASELHDSLVKISHKATSEGILNIPLFMVPLTTVLSGGVSHSKEDLRPLKP